MTDGVWSAYTAIPAGSIAPTLHAFTNPGLNFGGGISAGDTAVPEYEYASRCYVRLR